MNSFLYPLNAVVTIKGGQYSVPEMINIQIPLTSTTDKH